MLVRDKKQVTASWLAGFMEGESSFIKNNNHISVTIVNTDYDLIEACQDYLNRYRILHSLSEETKKTSMGKTMYRIYISKNDCYNLYLLLKDVLECRIDEYNQLVGTSTNLRPNSFKFDLEWLIGMWQAEGSLYIRILGQTRLYPCLEITNTRESIVNKIRHNLLKLGCEYYVVESNRCIRKPSTAFKIYGYKRCKVFLEATKDLWFSKRDQLRSSLMLELVNSRLSKHRLDGHTKRDIQIYDEMSDLNF